MYTSSVEGGKRGGPIKEAIIKIRIRSSSILIIAVCLILLMAELIIYL